NAKDKGKAVSNDYNSRNILPNSSSFNYFDACSYYGMCILGDAIGDSSFYKSVFSRYKNNKPSSIPTGDVDKNSCGILPIYLFTVSKDSSLLKLGKAAADNSLEKNGYPRTAIDDTYMTGALMVQAYRATGELKYLDFFAGYLLTYMGKLQQPNGLYWHKLDSRHFWGRGNGWGAASSTELLMVLPKTHAKYDSVLAGYKKQMKGLIDVQKTSGIWMQLLDSKDTKNWEETSGTAMFLFAIFTGLRYGWLDSTTYLEPVKKGWAALMGYLPDAKLRNVAAGFWPSTGTANDYLNASRGQPGDSHGTAAFLWAATAAYKYFTEPVTSVNKNVDFRIISDKFNPAGTHKYFGLSGRLIGYERSLDNRKRPTPGIVIMRGVNSSRSNVTLE
ncbi:MAG TPA: glycoside hydrolase family 88 protein, partial [Chitinispirillaceae bacterium]|nr:glycoside hydrolase family 88 protein [Chitinispirillaceae bacterium]